MIVTFESLEAVRAYMPHPVHLEAIEVSATVAERFHAFYFHG
jgi:Stress responsive A/B Barrel Domain